MTQLQHPGAERLSFRNVSISKVIATTDNHSASFLTLIAELAGFSIYIQKITFSVTVEHNSEATVQSTDATAIPYAEINNPSTEGPFEFDFGEDGVQVTEGEGLVFRNSGAGMGLIVYVQAYLKPTATLVAKAAGMTSGYNTR